MHFYISMLMETKPFRLPYRRFSKVVLVLRTPRDEGLGPQYQNKVSETQISLHIRAPKP